MLTFYRFLSINLTKINKKSTYFILQIKKQNCKIINK